MKHIISLIVFISIFSCCSKTRYIPVKELEFRNVYFRDTTIKTVLVPYRNSVVSEDTFSYIKNRYAESRAMWSEGRLFHELNILPDTISFDFQVEEVEIIRTIEVPVEAEKKLTKWEKIKMDAGGFAISALSGLIIVIVIYTLFKRK